MQNNNPDNLYTYTDAGFNRFFRRSFGSNVNTTNLSNLNAGRPRQEIRFDQQQISGAMGDALALGRIKLDGKTGRISVFDERGNEVMRLGDLGSD